MKVFNNAELHSDKEAYVSPVVESVSVHVENGFAASGGGEGRAPAPGDNSLGSF